MLAWWVGRDMEEHLSKVQRVTPPTDKQGLKAFIDRWGVGAACRNNSVSSDSHL